MEEHSDLINVPIKLQTLLHQFIQLYDRFSVEHSLMTDRELKLLKKLEKLNETLENLNTTIVELNEFTPKVVTAIEEIVEKVYIKLSQLIEQTIERKLDNTFNDYYSIFSDVRTEFKVFAKTNKTSETKVLILILVVVSLCSLFLGMVISYYFLRC